MSGRDKENCNFVEYRDEVIVYKRYASLYFILALEKGSNEVLAMEMIHFYVELLDSYFGIFFSKIFNFLFQNLPHSEKRESD